MEALYNNSVHFTSRSIICLFRKNDVSNAFSGHFKDAREASQHLSNVDTRKRLFDSRLPARLAVMLFLNQYLNYRSAFHR